MPQFLHSTSRGVAEGPWADWSLPLGFPRLACLVRGPSLATGRKVKSAGAWTLRFESNLHQLWLRDLGLVLPFLPYPSLSYPIFPQGLA